MHCCSRPAGIQLLNSHSLCQPLFYMEGCWRCVKSRLLAKSCAPPCNSSSVNCGSLLCGWCDLVVHPLSSKVCVWFDYIDKISPLLSYLFTFLNAQLQPHSQRVMNERHIRPNPRTEAKQVLWVLFCEVTVGTLCVCVCVKHLFKYLSSFIPKVNTVFVFKFTVHISGKPQNPV